YKWVERYQADGPAGLHGRSRRLHACPHQTAGAIVDALLEARRRHPTPTVISPAGVVATARTIPMKFVNGPSRIRTAWPTLNSAGAIRPPPPSRCAVRLIRCTPNVPV